MNRSIHILLVEDNAGDIKLMSKLLGELETSVKLSVARDGVDAAMLLAKMGTSADFSPPNLILLDLNLPKKDGRELLKEIKLNPLTKSIPVIILTTSNAEADVRTCYELHANCFIKKPASLEELRQLVKNLEIFWMESVTLPV